ncbi:ABC transporter ATP-binding protein, partial [Vreelandella glaciei]|uniref:ABC transporter ATP-binding protein n=1 Tax=Vreelandella glaciei TaxID=186761 RepID=UPI0030EF76D0
MAHSSHSHQPPRLKGEALHAGYDNRRVLDGVDIAIEEGKLTVLLGPNGSGKSTLLKTLARTLTPTGGNVYLDGKDIHRSKTREVA